MNGFLRLNLMDEGQAMAALEKCCGSTRWVLLMMTLRPFRTLGDVLAKAQRAWWEMQEEDWLEAFAHHPKIGDVDSLRKKFATTAQLASGEQAGVDVATEETLQGLAAGNAAYEQKNGFIFIVCATGKTAVEMLELLNARLVNDRKTELKNAVEEQEKILFIRLRKLQDASL